MNRNQSEEGSLFDVTQMKRLPVTTMQIEKATKVHWENDLRVQGNGLLWGIHVIVLEQLQKEVLYELQWSSMGITNEKRC